MLILSCSSPVQADDVTEKTDDIDKWSVKFTPFGGQFSTQAEADLDASVLTFFGSSIILENKLNAHFSAGIDLSYEKNELVASSVPAGFNMATTLGLNRFAGSAYGEFNRKGVTLKQSFKGGIDDYFLERPDVPTGLIATASTPGFQVGTKFEASTLIPAAKGFFLQPQADIDYQFVSIRGTTEEGAGSGNIQYDRLNDTRIAAQIGAGIIKSIPHSKLGLVTPFLNTKYRRNFINGPPQTTARLASGAMELGEIAVLPSQGANGIALDAGVSITGKDGIDVLAVYAGQFFKTSTLHSVAAQIKFSF